MIDGQNLANVKVSDRCGPFGHDHDGSMVDPVNSFVRHDKPISERR
jgi:hypothetical protein